MEKYISKDTLVAEIERKLKNINLYYVNAGSHPLDTDTNKKLQDGISKFLQSLLSFIDTLDVKEVDLEKELLSFYRHTNDSGSEIALAKHFFELGLKAAQEVE